MDGYEVATANSAEEAMSLRIEEYSIILPDVMMGEMSGFQMAGLLKADTATSDTPLSSSLHSTGRIIPSRD